MINAKTTVIVGKAAEKSFVVLFVASCNTTISVLKTCVYDLNSNLRLFSGFVGRMSSTASAHELLPASQPLFTAANDVMTRKGTKDTISGSFFFRNTRATNCNDLTQAFDLFFALKDTCSMYSCTCATVKYTKLYPGYTRCRCSVLYTERNLTQVSSLRIFDSGNCNVHYCGLTTLSRLRNLVCGIYHSRSSSYKVPNQLTSNDTYPHRI